MVGSVAAVVTFRAIKSLAAFGCTLALSDDFKPTTSGVDRWLEFCLGKKNLTANLLWKTYTHSNTGIVHVLV